jgi:hypothetical protein
MRNDRADIEAPETRVRSILSREIDIGRGCSQLGHRCGEVGTLHREHAAVVGGIGMHVQDACAGNLNGRCERRDAPRVPSFRNVRYG